MAGIGIANIAGGLLGGFPVSASSSRTPVAEQAGSRTQLTGVVGAALLIAFILLAPGLTAYLPSATLAAVVISAAVSLIDVRGVPPALCAWTRSMRRSRSPRSSACSSSAC